jgi:cysteine desulfurase
MSSSIYLDYNATTPLDKRVLDTMLPFFSEQFGNAASRTHVYGWLAADAVDKARTQVAALIGAEEQEIIFTSGATEAINLGIKGVFDTYFEKGKHIVTVASEHKAVLDTCAALEKRGAEVTYLPVDREGNLDLNLLEKSIRPDTILVCIMLANNETGCIHPIDKISAIVSERKSILLCDATQAVGKIHIDLSSNKIGLLALSAHKLYGPKGTGALYVRRKNPRVSLLAQLDGGGHERGLRSGTLNVPGIVGLGKACELAKELMWDESARISKLRTQLEQYLLDLGEVYINGSIRHRLPNTTNIQFAGIASVDIIVKLKNLAFSTGSACSSATQQASHVLRAMGISEQAALSSLRFSLGRYTTTEEIETCIAQISKAIHELRTL